MEKSVESIITQSNNIVIIQADNPDADSLASSLALEQILSALGKEVTMYCGTTIPGYLRYLTGWDRVTDELPRSFDSSIIVDASTETLLEQLAKQKQLGWVKAKPCIIIDHHLETDNRIDFADVEYVKQAVSTGEILYELSEKLAWPCNNQCLVFIAASILADSLGLTSEGTSSRSIHIIAELVEKNVSISKLENDRRALQKKSPRILDYKGDLLKRVEYSQSGRVAIITIPWEEIEKYSNEYNPAMLVLDEMRLVEGVAIAVAFKLYDNKITAKLRANLGYGIAGTLAAEFGGGGHPYAAGFKILGDYDSINLKKQLIDKAERMIDRMEDK